MSNLVVLKSKKELSLSAPLVSKKPLVWNEANGFKCEVPIELAYLDSFGEKKVLSRNWAQELVNNYGEKYGLEFDHVVEAPPVVPTFKKEKKKHEKDSV